ncbi:helix-turn-helix domain-containing protein [Sphingomonas sp. UYP23]
MPPNGVVQTSHMKFSSPLKFPLSSVPMALGATLRDAREARGWTQARLAAAAGIKRETVARLEAQRLLPHQAKRRRPAADTVFRLQAALDLMPGELVPAWPEWNPVGLSTIGTRSRVRRRDLGLSLKTVAVAAGISAATLSRFERDIRWETKSLLDGGPGTDPTEAAEALARALGFPDGAAHGRWCDQH